MKKLPFTLILITILALRAGVSGEDAVIHLLARGRPSRIVSIDAGGKTFTILNDDGKEVKHMITARTGILNGDKAAKFKDLKVGDYISGEARKTGKNEYEVVQITKFGPEAKPAGGKKPEATQRTKPITEHDRPRPGEIAKPSAGSPDAKQEKKAAARSDDSDLHALARDHPRAKAPAPTPTPTPKSKAVGEDSVAHLLARGRPQAEAPTPTPIPKPKTAGEDSGAHGWLRGRPQTKAPNATPTPKPQRNDDSGAVGLLRGRPQAKAPQPTPTPKSKAAAEDSGIVGLLRDRPRAKASKPTPTPSVGDPENRRAKP